MKITQIIWLNRFVQKIEQKHAVRPTEVEQIFANQPRVQFAERGRVPGEDLYSARGQTDSGRYLVVFFLYKGRGRALVVSARDMDEREKKSHGKK
ncbi:MAG TPA: BrnT family toxin [Blastocatellia bacterium]